MRREAWILKNNSFILASSSSIISEVSVIGIYKIKTVNMYLQPMWRSEQKWVGKLFRNFRFVRFLTICNQMWVFGCIRQLKEWETRMGAQCTMPTCMYCLPEYANFSTTRLNLCLFLMAVYQSSRSRQW